MMIATKPSQVEKTAAIARSAQSSLRERHSNRYTVQKGRADRHRAHSQPCGGWDVLHVLRLPRSAIVRWLTS
jgi:hypothetical protein